VVKELMKAVKTTSGGGRYCRSRRMDNPHHIAMKTVKDTQTMMTFWSLLRKTAFLSMDWFFEEYVPDI
jgi:hypothetical protein